MRDFNVILITIDSLRADYVGCCSGQKVQGQKSTPNLDGFAKDGLAFNKAFAQAPYTRGSFSSLFTSQYPSVASTPNGVLSDNPTIAEILRKSGYHTAGFHSNPFLSKAFGYDRGFDIFDDSLFPTKLPQRLHLAANKLFRMVRRQPYLAADGVNRKALAWLKRVSQPFFLWVHYMDTHGPYQPKGGFTYLNKIRAERLWHKAVTEPDLITSGELKVLRSGYCEEVRHMDKHLGSFLQALSTLGLNDNSLIAVLADHGDGFYEHRQFSHPRQLYEELVWVPLIVKLPGMNQGKVISRPVGLIDVVPTIIDALELKGDEELFEGHSLLPLLKDEHSESVPDWVISEATPDREYDLLSIRTREWEFILNEGGETRELYNLVEDPQEQINLINGRPGVAKELEEKLLAHRPRSRKFEGPKPEGPELDKEVERRLKDLGYLD